MSQSFRALVNPDGTVGPAQGTGDRLVFPEGAGGGPELRSAVTLACIFFPVLVSFPNTVSLYSRRY